MTPIERPDKGQSKHGPAPLRLKIEGDLGDAVLRIMQAGKPATPKKSKRSKKK